MSESPRHHVPMFEYAQVATEPDSAAGHCSRSGGHGHRQPCRKPCGDQLTRSRHRKSTVRPRGFGGAALRGREGAGHKSVGIGSRRFGHRRSPGTARGSESATGLRNEVTGGVRWKLADRRPRRRRPLAASIVLAHLLTPNEFGLAGMALVFTGIGVAFGDLALSAALIQRHELREEDRSTAFWTNAAAGTFLMLVGIAISPLVADFFGQPSVAPLFAGDLGRLPSLGALLHAERLAHARDEFPRPRNPGDRGRVRGRGGGVLARSRRRRRVGARRPGGGAGRHLARASLDVLALAAEAHVLEGEPARASAPTAARRSAPRVSATS